MSTELLVTGGGGLLGHALKTKCPDAVFLTRKDGDLTDTSEAERVFNHYRPEKVIHLAADVGGVQKNALLNVELFSNNVRINTNVLDAARKNGTKQLVSTLSGCALKFYPDKPSSENDLHVGTPFRGNLGYGYAKRMLDVQTKLIYDQYGLAFSSIIPMTMYGPNDNFDLETGHVIASLVHRCFLAKQNDAPLEVWGTGKAVRQFVFSEDVARVVLKALESDWGPETVVVTPDEGIEIGALAKHIAEVLDFKGEIVFNTSRTEGERFRTVKSRRFGALLPGFQFTSLRDGLKQTTKWFLAHQPRHVSS
jgi:GDP-L-fucose synthase